MGFYFFAVIDYNSSVNDKVSSMTEEPILSKATCKRCGHTWTKRVIKPVRCPKCQSPYWDIDYAYRGTKEVGNEVV